MPLATKRLGALAAAIAALSLLAGCSGGGTAASTDDGGIPALSKNYTGDKVSLTLWGGNPKIATAVDAFNKAQSKITVKFVEQPGADTLQKNLRNAVKASNGPDLFDTQTEQLNSFASDGIAADLTTALSNDKSEFSKASWSAVTTGGHTFGVPASQIPTFGLANAKVFKDAGLSYPTTWEQVISDGKKLNERGVKIINLAGEDYTNYVYMSWQAGAQWWKLDGDKWTVNVDSKETAKAADTLQQMIDDDIVSKISYADYNAMMQQYDQGKIAFRTLSTWQTAGMQTNLKSTLGSWEPSAYPSYEGQQPSNQSFTRAWAVNDKSKHKEAAAYTARWLATDDSSVKALASPTTGTGWFPAVADPSPYVGISEPSTLIGDHADKWDSTVNTAVEQQSADNWTYGPDASAAFAELANWWGKALAGQIKVSEIAPHMQKWIVNDMKQQGLTVSGQ